MAKNEYGAHATHCVCLEWMGITGACRTHHQANTIHQAIISMMNGEAFMLGLETNPRQSASRVTDERGVWMKKNWLNKCFERHWMKRNRAESNDRDFTLELSHGCHTLETAINGTGRFFLIVRHYTTSASSIKHPSVMCVGVWSHVSARAHRVELCHKIKQRCEKWTSEQVCARKPCKEENQIPNSGKTYQLAKRKAKQQKMKEGREREREKKN